MAFAPKLGDKRDCENCGAKNTLEYVRITSVEVRSEDGSIVPRTRRPFGWVCVDCGWDEDSPKDEIA